MALYEIKNGLLEAVVDSDDGMNVISIKYNGTECVQCDLKKKAAGRTYAVPILFPTPNRTRGESYLFEGRRIPAERHGYAKKAAFSIIRYDERSVKGEINFKDTPTCPFDIKLTVLISAMEDRIRWDFAIDNRSQSRFPFGLALHPFFEKKNFRAIKSDLKGRMLTDENLLPNGEVVFTDEYEDGRSISDLTVDAVFIADNSISSTLLGDDFSLTVKGSDEFTHVVIFTGEGEEFICVEPQTCSTDAINMHCNGFEREAGLIIMEPAETRRLSIDFSFSKNY